jgi:septum formation protein
MKLLILLASESPRRREILQHAGLQFQPFSMKVSEILGKNLNPKDQVLKISRDKGLASLDQAKSLKNNSYLLIAADTLVALDQEIFGKPENIEQACLTLKRLSGNKHQVWTGVWMQSFSVNSDSHSDNLPQVQLHQNWHFAEVSEVQFKPLTDSEIRAYVNTGEPIDKAGSYAIQGLGNKFVDHYTGSFENIVGLPIASLQKIWFESKLEFQNV